MGNRCPSPANKNTIVPVLYDEAKPSSTRATPSVVYLPESVEDGKNVTTYLPRGVRPTLVLQSPARAKSGDKPSVAFVTQKDVESLRLEVPPKLQDMHRGWTGESQTFDDRTDAMSDDAWDALKPEKTKSAPLGLRLNKGSGKSGSGGANPSGGPNRLAGFPASVHPRTARTNVAKSPGKMVTPTGNMRLDTNRSDTSSAFVSPRPFNKVGSHAYLTQSALRLETLRTEKSLLNKPATPWRHAKTKYVALVAHNEMKPTMFKFVEEHMDFFSRCKIATTESTGRSLEKEPLGLKVAKKVSSGPLGGDQEIGALISQRELGAVFFFRDPLSSHPHESDIQALVRLCDVHNILATTNPRSGTALVYALQNNPEFQEFMKYSKDQDYEDSAVVKAYKKRQTAVINAVGVPKNSPRVPKAY